SQRLKLASPTWKMNVTRGRKQLAKEVVLHAAHEKGNVNWKGQLIYFNQDLSRDTIQKRLLHNYLKTQYPTGLFRVL
uniref:Uncharacterized protein n=1 Tax=Sparus aurata TaxID=8175 RepID=A0A671UU47_SPAAU